MTTPNLDSVRVNDYDEHGVPVPERYRRLGASGLHETGLYVRFEPGFGLNVHIGHRLRNELVEPRGLVRDHERMVLGIDGWERLCELVDEWRAREARQIDGSEDGPDE